MHGADATPPSGYCLTAPGLSKKTCFFNLSSLWLSLSPPAVVYLQPFYFPFRRQLSSLVTGRESIGVDRDFGSV